MWELWNNTQVNLDNTFLFHVSQHLDDDWDPTIVAKACRQSDSSMWGEAMRFELESLRS